MVNLTLPGKGQSYTPECGDILWEGREYLVDLNKSSTEDFDILPLAYVNMNPFNACKKYLKINIDPLLNSSYECPYTGYKHYGIVPTIYLSKGVLCENPEQSPVIKKLEISSFLRWAFDSSYLEKQRKEARDSEIVPSCAQILMGLGYTYGTTVTDGSGSQKKGLIGLEDGNYLQVWFWEWYNK